VLALRAARGWNTSQVAGRFLVEPATIASWLGRVAVYWSSAANGSISRLAK
jgi:hypothetical protein